MLSAVRARRRRRVTRAAPLRASAKAVVGVGRSPELCVTDPTPCRLFPALMLEK